ncbi:MAG: hypothetical protein Q4E61_02985 [Alphaproteobacteria bacterium]|nr:hypothetical protein [Alphaproteobacteria bacterium]
MLKHGQIKFTKKAAQFAEEYFKKKKIGSFLVVIKRGEQSPSGYKGFYTQLLGEKQDPSSTYKVYTNNIEKAKKLFETSLIKEGRLSCIFSPKFNCLLYLSKDQQDKFKKIISPDTDFPEGLLNEKESDCVAEFERKMNKTSSVDLSDLILKINEESLKNPKENSEIYSSDVYAFLDFIDSASESLSLWITFLKSLC